MQRAADRVPAGMQGEALDRGALVLVEDVRDGVRLLPIRA